MKDNNEYKTCPDCCYDILDDEGDVMDHECISDNEMIAEFMGVHDEISLDSIAGNIHSWSDAPFFFITEDSKEKVIEGIAKYSKYDTSWDWLMPVVQKCFDTQQPEEGQHYFINESLLTMDIEVVYDRVVEFIKTYNDGSTRTS